MKINSLNRITLLTNQELIKKDKVNNIIKSRIILLKAEDVTITERVYTLNILLK